MKMKNCCFENETGAGDPVREDKIAAALIGSDVQAVILSTCERGKAASDALNNISQIYDAQGDYATALEYSK
jgi:hypothetical protein